MSRSQTLWASLLVAASLTLVACGKNEAEALASAKLALDKRDFKTATVELKAMLQETPNSGEGRFLLGRALMESGDLPGAEAELTRALENKYSDEAVAPVMAQVLLGQRQYRKLTDRYAKFEVADFQGATQLKVALGMAFAAQGQKEDAQAAIKRALEIKPDSPEANVAQARLLASDGKADEALQVLDALLAKAPKTTEALHLKGGLLQQAKGDLAGAAQVYRKELEIRNDLPEAHAALIALAFAQRDTDAANRQIEELKKILPNHPQTKYFEAQAAFAKGEYAKARDLLQPLLRATPEHVGLLHLAGATEFKLNSTAQAETYLAKAIQLAPNFIGARRVMAQVYLRAQQPAKVQSVLKPILDSGKADPETLSLLAQAAAMQGDTKAADDYFARAAKLKPDDTRIRAAQALGQVARGNADTAFIELESLAAADKGSAVDLALISAHIRRNEMAEALKAIDALDKKQPGSAVAPNLRGRVLLQQKDVEGARKSFEQAIAREPKFVAAAAALAAIDLSQKKPEAAKARFEAVLKADPKSTQAMLALGELASRAGDKPEQVLKWINDAVAAEPTNPMPRLSLVDYHMRTRDLKAAATAAQAAVAAIPDNTDLLDRQARLQMASGDAQQAVSTFSRITLMHPTSASAFVNLGEAQMSANDLDGAARAARQALELAPTAAPAQKLAVNVAVRQKRWKDALAVARDMQTQQPKDASGYLVEGEVELEQKNFDNAIAAFRKATNATDPGQAPARLHMALLQAKRDAEAGKFADGWLAAHPKDGLFLYHLGDVALGRNDLPGAERRYSEVLKLQPEHALALNNVAWLMVQQKRAGAVPLAERAVKAAPNQPPLMDTLALALAAESQLPKALELQKKVVEMAPQAPSFRLNLARMLLQSGEKAAARTELEKLEKLGTAFAGHAEVKELLRKAGA